MRMAEESLGKRGTAHAQEHLNQGHSEDAALIRQNQVQADLPLTSLTYTPAHQTAFHPILIR